MSYPLFQIPRSKSELRCAIAAKRRPRHLDCGNIAVARVLETCDVLVDSRDASVAKPMLTVGFWEWSITKAIADCMRPGTCCVDLGANAGYFGALFQSLGAAKVVAVEANPTLASRLRETASRNGWNDFEVIECAVGEAEGSARLLVYGDDNLGGSCVVPRSYRHPGCIDVPVRSLDQLLGELQPIQVMKIDCEGSEPAIWRGMQNVLRNNPDMHIFAELAINPHAEPWLREVQAMGYPLRYVCESGGFGDLDFDMLPRQELWMAYFHRDRT